MLNGWQEDNTGATAHLCGSSFEHSSPDGAHAPLLGDRTPQDKGPWPGVLVDWRRGTSGWEGRVVYVIADEEVVVEVWVPASMLRPAGL